MTDHAVSPQRTIDQKRAQQAWENIVTVKNKDLKEYRALVRGAPADIQISGLGQFLAFLRAKGKPDHCALYEQLREWLAKQNYFSGNDLLEWISRTATTEDYRRATAEVMSFLMWLKRFAEAELKDNHGSQQ